MTLVLVDGNYDSKYKYLVSFLPTREIVSIDVIRCADNFMLIWAEKVGELDIKGTNICGSIINIKTRLGAKAFWMH
jgi:hypothetical protein